MQTLQTAIKKKKAIATIDTLQLHTQNHHSIAQLHGGYPKNSLRKGSRFQRYNPPTQPNPHRALPSSRLIHVLFHRPQNPRQSRRLTHALPPLPHRPHPRRPPETMERTLLLLLPLRPTTHATSSRPCPFVLSRPVPATCDAAPIPARVLDYDWTGVPYD